MAPCGAYVVLHVKESNFSYEKMCKFAKFPDRAHHFHWSQQIVLELIYKR